MEINPKVKIYTGAIAAVLGVLLGCGTQFTTLFGAAEASRIIAGVSIASLGFGALIVYFGVYSSTVPGPWAPKDAGQQGQGAPTPGATVKSLALLAMLGGAALAVMLLGAGQARAAGNPLNAIGNWANSDVDAGNAAAIAYPDLQDEVAATCGKEIKNLAQIIHDHPFPLTAHLWTDVVYARLAQGKLNRICRVPACQQVWSDMGNAAAALEIIPLPISFSAICKRVPVVGLTLSQPAATIAPAATPTPAAK